MGRNKNNFMPSNTTDISVADKLSSLFMDNILNIRKTFDFKKFDPKIWFKFKNQFKY